MIAPHPSPLDYIALGGLITALLSTLLRRFDGGAS